MKNSHKTSHRGGRRWLSKEQIAIKYQSTDVAEEICAAKEADQDLRSKDTKAHPDRPGKLLYLVWDEEYYTEERDELLEQLFEQRDEDEDESNHGKGRKDHKASKTKKDKSKKAKRTKKRKQSSTESSETSSEDTMSDSSSDTSSKSSVKTRKTKNASKGGSKKNKGKGDKKDKKDKKEKKDKKLTPEQQEAQLKKDKEKELKAKDKAEKAQEEKTKRDLRNSAKKVPKPELRNLNQSKKNLSSNHAVYIYRAQAVFLELGSFCPFPFSVGLIAGAQGAKPTAGCDPRYLQEESEVYNDAPTSARDGREMRGTMPERLTGYS